MPNTLLAYSALTLEHLESTFYSQGFQKFPTSDFAALGLKQSDIDALQQIGNTEATHVTTLQTVITALGATPVEPCTYNFGFTNAAGMVATARILEAVGISA
jgi:Ferritin-like domain